MKHTIVDFATMIESVRKDGRMHDYEIDKLEVYWDYLHYSRKYVGHAHYKFIEYHLFPNENIGIYKLYSEEGPGYDPKTLYHYYVDMVSVVKDKKMWDIKDLYIDFIVKKDGKEYVVDIDEFNAAISRKELSAEDISAGLNGLDCILKGYYTSFDMEQYLEKLQAEYMNKDYLVYAYCMGQS